MLSGQINQLLSIDGAGIYGLTQALWLSQLVEQDPSFMDWSPEGTRRPLLAGASAGAVNGLLLARESRSRDVVGDLVSFWNDRRFWANDSWPYAWLSVMGVTAWYGTSEARAVLDDYFGELRMGELAHPVAVSIYDLSGSRSISGARRQWHPLTVTNFPVHAGGLWVDGRDLRVADVAYAATAVPGLREVCGGWAYGGAYANADPVLQGIMAAEVFSEKITDIDPTSLLQELVFARDARRERYFDLLNELAVFSIGDGGPKTWYAREDFNQSSMQHSMIPSNLGQLPQGIFPPFWFLVLTGPSQLATQTGSFFTKPGHFFRLNPPVTSIPVAATVQVARSNLIRTWLIQQIEAGVGSQTSREAIAAALWFLRSEAWTGRAGD